MVIDRQIIVLKENLKTINKSCPFFLFFFGGGNMVVLSLFFFLTSATVLPLGLGVAFFSPSLGPGLTFLLLPFGPGPGLLDVSTYKV